MPKSFVPTLFALLLSLYSFSQNWQSIYPQTGVCCYSATSVKMVNNQVFVVGNNQEAFPNKVEFFQYSSKGELLNITNLPKLQKHRFAEYMNPTRDGNWIVCGYLQDTNSTDIDYFITKLTQLGEVIWDYSYPIPAKNSTLEYIEQDTDGNFIACGYNTQSDFSSNDILVLKFSEQGEIMWSHNFGFGKNDVGHMVRPCKDGGYIVSGDTQELLNDGYDMAGIKLSNNGDLEWQINIGDLLNNGNQAVLETSDGYFLFCGEGNVRDTPGFDIALAKVDAQGTVRWFRNCGSPGAEAGFNIIEKNANEFFICGYTNPDPEQGKNLPFVAKIDSAGKNIGAKIIQTPQIGIAYDLCFNADSNLVLVGTMGYELVVLSTNDGDYTDLFSTANSLIDVEGKKAILYFDPILGTFCSTKNEHIGEYTVFNLAGKEVISDNALDKCLPKLNLKTGIYTIYLNTYKQALKISLP